MKELKHNDYVRVNSWIRADETVKFSTLVGYCKENKYSEEMIESILEKEQERCWTSHTGTAIYGDKSMYEYQDKIKAERFANCITLEHEENVLVEGIVYKVIVMRGNEKYPYNSDPIHFEVI